MKLITVEKRSHLKKFLDFPDTLYKGDPNYVPYMRGDLKKTLTKLLFTDKTYTALLVVDDDGKTLARILFTVDKSKQLKSDKCGFFSMFECVDNQKIADTVLNGMFNRLKAMGADCISGTYFPYDQDNRRGILYRGFDRAPLILTSYNPSYYNDLLVDFGMQKLTDAYQYTMSFENFPVERLKKITEYSMKKYGFRVDTVDWNNLDRDIRDMHTVMEEASNEIIFQDVPSIETLYGIVAGWRKFLNKDFIYIARRTSDGHPIGAVMAIPDYFQLFQKMRGRMDLRGIFAYLKYRNKITSLRAILQYVIPEYQKKGVSMAMYAKIQQNVLRYGMNYVEAGTIMENNAAANDAITAVGGELSRIYRIYCMKIK